MGTVHGSIHSSSPGASIIPAGPEEDRREKDLDLNRKRVARWRDRRLKEAFRGLVRLCGGPENCLWHRALQSPEGIAGEGQAQATGDGIDGLLETPPIPPCRCKPALPCRCERELRGFIERRSEAYLGFIPGQVLTDAILDLVRCRVLGKEVEVRSARIQLLGLLAADQRGRRALDLQERRIQLEEGRQRPKGETLQGYLQRVYGDRAEQRQAGRTSMPGGGMGSEIIEPDRNAVEPRQEPQE